MQSHPTLKRSSVAEGKALAWLQGQGLSLSAMAEPIATQWRATQLYCAKLRLRAVYSDVKDRELITVELLSLSWTLAELALGVKPSLNTDLEIISGIISMQDVLNDFDIACTHPDILNLMLSWALEEFVNCGT
jgi:hypothetical protein